MSLCLGRTAAFERRALFDRQLLEIEITVHLTFRLEADRFGGDIAPDLASDLDGRGLQIAFDLATGRDDQGFDLDITDHLPFDSEDAGAPDIARDDDMARATGRALIRVLYHYTPLREDDVLALQ